MLFPLRTRPLGTSDDPLAPFLECHARIRTHLAIAERIATAPATPASDVGDEIARAAERVRRYFAEALPLHEADEERSLAPRLVSEGDDTSFAWLDRMTRDHAQMAGGVAELVVACDAMARGEAVPRAFPTVVHAVVAAMDAHLQMEEELLFPRARRLLGEADFAAIRAEIEARRAITR